ncbi:MAG: HyaD/HybD family hydrogenase maturation endopeptidase [Pseudomonadota bacterium]
MKVLILAIGNLLLSDEGVGIHVLHALERDYRFPDGVILLDGGTSGLDLLIPIEEAQHLILIDAVDVGAPPGTLSRLDGSEIPRLFQNKLSPHQVSLLDVLAAATLMGVVPRTMTLFGIQPAVFDIGMTLSPGLASRLPELTGEIIAELARLGWPAIPRDKTCLKEIGERHGDPDFLSTHPVLPIDWTPLNQGKIRENNDASYL